jgi:glycosyltransferase involved in cell wall biosynthesis
MYLERLLSSLDIARRRCPIPTEVLIIDSSPVTEAKQIKCLCDNHNATYVRGPLSVRTKRNEGIKRACHPVVVFVDSDCEAHPDLLLQHLQSYEEQPYLAGVLGQVIFTGPKNWMWQIVRFTPFTDAFAFATKWPYAIWGPTANISYKRDLLVRIGMFDESFPFKLGADDVDLGLRVTKANNLLRCNPDAIVYHSRDTWTQGAGIFTRAVRWGRMEYHLLRKHPYLKQTDHPKLTVLLSILTGLSGLLFLFTQDWVWLVLPWVWLVGVWVTEWALGALTKTKESWHPGILAAQVIAWCYELGFCYESLLRGHSWLIFERPLFHLGQLNGEWPSRVIRLWSIILVTAALIVLLPWL